MPTGGRNEILLAWPQRQVSSEDYKVDGVRIPPLGQKAVSVTYKAEVQFLPTAPGEVAQCVRVAGDKVTERKHELRNSASSMCKVIS